jgi:hypothetical protein
MPQDEPKITVQLPSTPRAVAWLKQFDGGRLHELWKASDLHTMFGVQSSSEREAQEKYFAEASFWLAVAAETLRRVDLFPADRSYLEATATKIGARRKKVAELGNVAGQSEMERVVARLLGDLNNIVPTGVTVLVYGVVALVALLVVLQFVRK